MSNKFIYDGETAPGGPSRRQISQHLHKLTSYSSDLDHLHKIKMEQQQCDQVTSLERLKFAQRYDNHFQPLHYFSGQSELKHNYSDSDEPSGFYQSIPLNQHYHSSHRQFTALDRLPKHKHIENSFHQKLQDSNLFMLHSDQQHHRHLKAPVVTTHGILMTDNAISSETSPTKMPSSTSFPLTISRETAFKPINYKFNDRNSSSSTQSIHEYKSESIVVNNMNNEVGYSISNNSRNHAKINSTPNLLDSINKINSSVDSFNNSDLLAYKQQLQKQQLQPFKQFQQREKSYHDNKVTKFKNECTTNSMEELLKRQKKLDHLQYCLQRYEIEREEAGQAIRRIEERMRELEARASDLLEYDISNSLSNEEINPLQQQQRQVGMADPSINKLCSQSQQLTTEDLESQYIHWLKSIENSTHTLKSSETDRNLSSIYAQNNYMYIESSANNENDTSTHQPKSLCTFKHSFDPMTSPIVSNTSSSKTTTSIDDIYNNKSNSSQQETKRNLLLEHLMVQRQRLATADASVALLAKRLMLLNTSPKVQQDSALEKTFYKQKVSYPGTPLEQITSTCDERVDKASLYNQHAISNTMIPNILRNSNLISGKVNPTTDSEYSTDNKYHSQLQRSFEDDILTYRHSPRQNITGWRKSSTIERTNSSSVHYLLDSYRLNSNNNSNNITRSTNVTRKFNDNSTNYFKDNSNNELSNLQQNGDLSIANAERQRLPTPIRSSIPVRNIKPYSYKTQQPTKYASENGYIELANASSSPTNDDDYTSRLLYGTSKTQLPSRRFFNTNTSNISMTGFLTPINCSSSSSSIAATQPLLCKESFLMEKSPLHNRLTPLLQQQYQSQIQQPKVAPPLPPKPNLFHPQISLQETVQTQEHLSAEDEEVYKFMSRSFDTNDEINLDFQPLDRNLTDSKQRPLPPPYYVNINNTNEEKLLTQRKVFSHRTSKTVNNNKASKFIKETIPLNRESQIHSESLTSLTNDLTKEDDGSNSRLLNSSSKSRKSLSSIEKMKNQPETHKSKRYIKQKSDYAFNLRDYLQTLHHPINELSIKISDTTLLPEQQGGICLTSLLGNWLTSRTSRAQKSSLVDESLDYFQCKIILNSRICGGYLWIMKKPSRQRSNNNSISNNIWDSIMRRVHDTTFNQSMNNIENEKHNKRIIIRSSNNPRWYRKWLSCDMLEQKIFICERKECGRIESTINFTTITDIHQSSTGSIIGLS
ncbi:hypothetical protein EWB00_003039 [Schistosoma japonicum]|uniref:Uncharacterized protein n=1 Tax=Schistosoma japonicum TaxID=6182 RepID=A0A4Z2DA06_SCHJA|nr:hypothetical protein EWB00_003039 [Schistosoma japonicum]